MTDIHIYIYIALLRYESVFHCTSIAPLHVTKTSAVVHTVSSAEHSLCMLTQAGIVDAKQKYKSFYCHLVQAC